MQVPSQRILPAPERVRDIANVHNGLHKWALYEGLHSRDFLLE